jgi:hypothetical protein
MRGSLLGKSVFGGNPHDHAAAVEGRLVAFVLVHGVSSSTVDVKKHHSGVISDHSRHW